jgi:hypothetical protein
MTATYMVATTDMILDDGPGELVSLLHDRPHDAEGRHLAALVASGDYFVTLAVTLEEVAFSLPSGSVAQFQLQDIVGQLLRLQNHYRISKK